MLPLPPCRLACTAAAALTLLAALPGCGGSEGPDPRQSATAADARERVAASALPPPVVTVKDLFDWAEYKFPDLFPKPAALPDTPFAYEGVQYTVRGFANGNFLGLTSDGQIFGLGPFTGSQLTRFGTAADYAAQVQTDRCGVDPARCLTDESPVGPLNGCVAPAATALATGNRLRLQYAYTGTSAQGSGSGESIVESVVDGPATFEGQAVVRTSSKTTNSLDIGGFLVNSSSDGKEYLQATADGLTRFVGSETESSSAAAGGFLTRVKVVGNPPRTNREYTLAPGQSITLTETSNVTTTQLIGQTALPPTTTAVSGRRTHVYEARESLVVLGRTYDTCRYRSFDPATPADVTVQWLVRGIGVPARSVQVQAAGGSTTLELRSGTFNGSPI